MDSNASLTPPAAAVLRVLVADDNPDMLDLVASLLRKEGFLVGEATDGAELLGLANDGSQANLIVADVQMPVTSGLEVLSHMRTYHPLVPIILMSAFATHHLRERARENGAVAVLAKPFSIATLRELVARHVRRN